MKRRNILLLLAGAALFLTGSMCGFGAPAYNAAPAAPTLDLNQSSGGGGAPTSASAEETQPVQIELTAAPASTLLPLIIQPTGTAIIPTSANLELPAPAIPEARRVTLEYPPAIRAGDSDVVRLTLEVDTLGNVTPTAEVQGNIVTGATVQVPNLYDTHNVVAEARLDLAGVDVRPSDDISQTLLPGESLSFYWSVQPGSAGTFRGTVWLFLRFIDKATKEESRKALSAQPILISTTQLFGLTGNAARAAGGIGSIIGAVLGFPFVDDIFKWLWKRVRGGV